MSRKTGLSGPVLYASVEWLLGNDDSRVSQGTLSARSGNMQSCDTARQTGTAPHLEFLKPPSGMLHRKKRVSHSWRYARRGIRVLQGDVRGVWEVLHQQHRDPRERGS